MHHFASLCITSTQLSIEALQSVKSPRSARPSSASDRKGLSCAKEVCRPRALDALLQDLRFQGALLLQDILGPEMSEIHWMILKFCPSSRVNRYMRCLYIYILYTYVYKEGMCVCAYAYV